MSQPKPLPSVPSVPATLSELPEPDLELISYAQARKSNPQFTGRLLQGNPARCERICMDLIAGLSHHVIAAKHSVSRNSLRHVARILEASGQLEPTKRQVLSKISDLLKSGLDEAQRMLDEHLIPPGSIAVFNGVMFDKLAMASGEATSRHEVVSQKRIEVAELNSFIDSLPEAEVTEQPNIMDIVSTQLPTSQPVETQPVKENTND